LEDDARPVDENSLLDTLNYSVPPQVAFTSFHRSSYTTPGIHPARMFVMSQAIKIPARSLPWLLKWREVCWGDWNVIVGVDLAIAEAGHNNGWLYEQTERNYFDHVGLVSAARPSQNSVSLI
jgi:hypothetical protein